VRVAEDRVAAVLQRDRPGGRALRLHLGELVHAGAGEMEVVLYGAVAHGNLVLPRIDLRDERPVRLRERDVEVRPDRPQQLRSGGDRRRDEYDSGRGGENEENLESHTHLVRRGAEIGLRRLRAQLGTEPVGERGDDLLSERGCVVV
jgi:hypothetical protein